MGGRRRVAGGMVKGEEGRARWRGDISPGSGGGGLVAPTGILEACHHGAKATAAGRRSQIGPCRPHAHATVTHGHYAGRPAPPPAAAAVSFVTNTGGCQRRHFPKVGTTGRPHQQHGRPLHHCRLCRCRVQPMSHGRQRLLLSKAAAAGCHRHSRQPESPPHQCELLTRRQRRGRQASHSPDMPELVRAPPV